LPNVLNIHILININLSNQIYIKRSR